MSRLRAGTMLLRLLLANAGIALLTTATYLLLVPFVLIDDESHAAALASGALAGGITLALLTVQSIANYPVLGRCVESCASMEPPDPFDREAAYAAPRRASALFSLLGLVVLAYGYLPIGAAGKDRTVATQVGAVCIALGAGVLYASVRYALRPLVEALRADPYSQWDLEKLAVPRADRAPTRIALAVAVPTGAAALIGTLMVTAHLVAIGNDQDATAREVFNEALSVDLRPGEHAGGLAVAASALEGAHIPVEVANGRYAVPLRPPRPPVPPLWSLPIAMLLGVIAGQLGRRIGHNASMDLETAARRMAVVGAKDIRSVTMSIARPRSVPEVREMALALDMLAATLLRMADDQKRALTVRTEAARVRSFVLASVSHDLRGPLNSVLGFAELLLSGAEGPLTDSQRESLEALVRGARDLLRLVGDLLDHARLDAERMTIERSPVSMDTVIEKARVAAIERAKNPIAEDDMPIEGEAGLRVVADEERLAHAIGALAAFALLRPGSDGRVVLRLRREGERVAVAIHGGGSTPSRDALTRMFEPFDFAPTGARAPAGLNLAVSVARGVIRLHGGTVTAAPHDEGGIALLLALPSARVTGEYPEPEGSGIRPANRAS